MLLQQTRTWHTHGFYDYAHSRLHLDTPEGGDKLIGLDCDDAGEGVTDCRMIRETDGHVCGHAVLSRQMHH